jgi:hypothetical protein
MDAMIGTGSNLYLIHSHTDTVNLEFGIKLGKSISLPASCVILIEESDDKPKDFS